MIREDVHNGGRSFWVPGGYVHARDTPFGDPDRPNVLWTDRIWERESGRWGWEGINLSRPKHKRLGSPTSTAKWVLLSTQKFLRWWTQDWYLAGAQIICISKMIKENISCVHIATRYVDKRRNCGYILGEFFSHKNRCVKNFSYLQGPIP